MASIGPIIIAICVLASIGSIIYAYLKISKRTRQSSKAVFGTDNFYQISDSMRKELSGKPKQVLARTAELLPKITDNYGDFGCDEARGNASTIISVFLHAWSEGIKEINDATMFKINEQLKDNLATDKNDKVKRLFKDIKVHQTEIIGYTDNSNESVIKFQSSIEYITYLLNSEGAHISGSDTYKYQTKYDIEMVHDKTDKDLPFWYYRNIKEHNLG